MDAALPIPEEHTESILPEAEPLISDKLDRIRADTVFHKHVDPLLAQGRPGLKAAATSQMAIIAGPAQGLAKVLIHSNIIS